jgi:hypothetical protein
MDSRSSMYTTSIGSAQRSVVRSHAGDVLIETLFEVVCRADVKGVVTGIAGCTSMALDDDATS